MLSLFSNFLLIGFFFKDQCVVYLLLLVGEKCCLCFHVVYTLFRVGGS